MISTGSGLIIWLTGKIEHWNEQRWEHERRTQGHPTFEQAYAEGRIAAYQDVIESVSSPPDDGPRE